MRDAESIAAFVVCPLCDKEVCVGRYVCNEIAEHLKAKEELERKMKNAAD